MAELENFADVDKPRPLEISADGKLMKVSYIACGAFHVLACTTTGHLFGWGRNDYGQLGLSKKEPMFTAPTRIKSIPEKIITMVAAGHNHSLFLTELGEVFSCGFNEFGELGLGLSALVGFDEGTEGDPDFDQKVQ